MRTNIYVYNIYGVHPRAYMFNDVRTQDDG